MSPSRFKQSKISLFIPQIYVLGCFENLLVILGYILGFHMTSLKLLILLIFYLNEILEQLKTNIYTNFCSEWDLGFAIDYA